MSTRLDVRGLRALPAFWRWFGADEASGLAVGVLPAAGTPASLLHRTRLLGHAARGGWVLLRHWAHAAWLLKITRGSANLVFEAHEAPTGVSEGDARRVWSGVRAAWANCEGTAARLRDTFGGPVVPVIHNAARAAPAPSSGLGTTSGASGDGQGVGYVGSVRAEKDLATLVEAARRARVPVVLICPELALARALAARGGGYVTATPAIAPGEVPARLSRFRGLVASLGPGSFGQELTSPLKLWDALASGRPVIAPDTPAVRRVAGAAFVPYDPGDPASLASALSRVNSDRAACVVSAARPRTWLDRGLEVRALLRELHAPCA